MSEDKPFYAKSRQRKPDITTMVYGKVPPQSMDLEEAVIGACLLEKATFEIACGVIKTHEIFYSDAHQKIWLAMTELANSGNVVDLLTVTDKMRKMGDLEIVGGAYYLTKLTMSVMSGAHVEAHARIVVEKFISRELIRISGQSISDAYDETTDIFDLTDNAAAAISALQMGSMSKIPKSAAVLAMAHQERVSNLQNTSTVLSGVPTGYKELDDFTGGWQKQDLIILAARPSVGKTAFAINLAINTAKLGNGVIIFSLEMAEIPMTSRSIAAIGKIELYKMNQARRLTNLLDMREYVAANAEFSKLPIWIDEEGGITPLEMRAKARKIKSKNNIQLIIVDYLQLMKGRQQGKQQNREGEIASISRDLKTIAKELDVPIIALSQLNRGLEGRANKVPQLSDLRESGAIEQDADMVMFLYRPEYHGVNNDAMGESKEGLTEIHFGKFRNGDTTAKVELIFEKDIQLFREQSEWQPSPFIPDNPSAGIRPSTYIDPSQARNEYNKNDWKE